MQKLIVPTGSGPRVTRGYYYGPFLINEYGDCWALANISGLALLVRSSRAVLERCADALCAMDYDWYGSYNPDHVTDAERAQIIDIVNQFQDA